MNRSHFNAGFTSATKLALRLAQDVLGLPPPAIAVFDFTLALAAGDCSAIKLPGGRVLAKRELLSVPAERAVKLLWVNGQAPTRVNLMVDSQIYDQLHIRVSFSEQLAPPNGPWKHEAAGNPPFHVLCRAP